MTDDIFRIVVTVAVGLAALAFLIQAFCMLGLYRAVRKMQDKVDRVSGRGEKLIDKLEPIADTVSAEMPNVAPIVRKLSAASEKAGPLLEQARATLDKAGAVIVRATPAVDSINKILGTSSRILDETRPRISEISTEAVAITKEGHRQVERVGELIVTATDRARTRLEQIDQSVDSTIGQVEQVGESMKRAVMRPVKEVNGIAAGISAAVATLVKRPRRSSVDSATQDEEMFI